MAAAALPPSLALIDDDTVASFSSRYSVASRRSRRSGRRRASSGRSASDDFSVSSRSASSRSVRRRDVIRSVEKLDEPDDGLVSRALRDFESLAPSLSSLERLDEASLRSFGRGGRSRGGDAPTLPSIPKSLSPTEASPTSVADAPDSPGASTDAPDSSGATTLPSCGEVPTSTALVVRVPSDAGSAGSGSSRSGRSSGHNGRGLDPDEVVHGASRAVISYSGKDPPGESPGDRPVVCTDIVPRDEGSTASSYGGGRKYTNNVKWLDPKSVESEGDVDKSVLERYEEFSPTSNYEPPSSSSTALTVRSIDPPADPPAATTLTYQNPRAPAQAIVPYQDPTSAKVRRLLSNPRTRIATISSGFKKAEFFVREDLDTRIYFHHLEDALGYMARRGYSRMPKEEEREWRELLGKAHGVVKVGPKKEKQRYRKGKLVMVLKKTVTDGDKSGRDDSRPGKYRRRSAESSGPFTDSDASLLDARTARTSLGKSVRGKFQSYSEKFLSQQEEQKKQYLSAISERKPLPQMDWYGNDPNGGQLLLTDGRTNGVAPPSARSSVRSGTMDPDGKNGGVEGSEDSYTAYDTTLNSSNGTSYYSSAYSSTLATSVEDFRKSRSTVSSNRKGVYGGGVKYYNPEEDRHKNEETEDERTEGSEEEDSEIDYSDDESRSGSSYDRVVDDDGSDMGSMVSREESSYGRNRSGGVDSVYTMSTAGAAPPRRSASEPTPRGESRGSSRSSSGERSGRSRRSRSRKDPIGDDSSSSSDF